MLSSSLLATSLLLSGALGARLPLTGVRKTALVDPPGLLRRDAHSISLNDSQDILYYANITVGGVPYMATLDTGLSDLWVQSDTPIPGSEPTGKGVNVTYGKGSVAGPIKTVEVGLAGFTIPHQAYIEAVSANVTDIVGDGLLGLGLAAGSKIFDALGSKPAAEPPLHSIVGGGDVPAYFTVTLGRSSDDPYNPYPGELTVGEVLPGYEAVLAQPKLPMTRPANPAGSHWETLLDVHGVSINGQNVSLPTSSANGTQGAAQLTAVFHTGDTFPLLPKVVVDAIYANVSGAKFNSDISGGLWQVPCTAEINVTFYFAYPIHPLDTVMDDGISGGDCVGAFQANQLNATLFPMDILLGMAFLRNVYMLGALGNMTASTNASDTHSAPYVQLLSLTNDTAAAHAEFVQVRLSKKNGKKNAATRVGIAEQNVGGMLAMATIAGAVISAAF